MINGPYHAATFQTTYIHEIATSENNVMTYDIGTRNFAGYSNLYFEWYCESYRLSTRPSEYGYLVSISRNPGSINDAISNQVVNIVEGGDYTNIVSLKNIQTPDHWYITTRWNKTSAGYGTIQIKRIWLA